MDTQGWQAEPTNYPGHPGVPRVGRGERLVTNTPTEYEVHGTCLALLRDDHGHGSTHRHA